MNNYQEFNSCSNSSENTPFGQDYRIMVPSDVDPRERSSGPNEKMPKGQNNGGLYGGPQCDRPWMPIHVTPTATNYMYNLQSANPPPGAVEQYVGTNRSGNNYTAMPEVFWHKTKGKGPYNIKVTH